MRFKNRKIAHSFNNLNNKINYNTLSYLKFRNHNLIINNNESNKNNFNSTDVKPIISQTYYKDPFSLTTII